MNEPGKVTPKRLAGFLSPPSTGVGKWSGWLLLISLALMLLHNLVVMPEAKQRTSLELAQRGFSLAVFLCVVFAGVTGRFAIVVKRERSGALFVAVLLLVLATALNLGPLVHG